MPEWIFTAINAAKVILVAVLFLALFVAPFAYPKLAREMGIGAAKPPFTTSVAK